MYNSDANVLVKDDNVIQRLKSCWKLKLILSVLLTVAFCSMYSFLQHYLFFPVTELKATWIENRIPFYPDAVYLYLSLWLLLPIAPWLLVSNESLFRYCKGFLWISAAGFLIFFFFPTAVARPTETEQFNTFYAALIHIDKAFNAFPSMHVALAVFSARWFHSVISQLKKYGWLSGIVWLWAAAICVSTLLIKQHVFVDVAGGYILGWMGFFIYRCRQSFLRNLFFSGLLDTGFVTEHIYVIRDGYVNFYVIKTRNGLICIDAGWSVHGVKQGFKALGFRRQDVIAIFLTHLDWDHAGAIKKYPCASIYMGEKAPQPRKYSRVCIRLRDGQTVTISGITMQAIATPGHSPGSVSYVFQGKCLFTGDTLLLRKGGVSPFHRIFNKDSRTALLSIKKLAHLDGIEVLLTGHSGVTLSASLAFRKWVEPAVKKGNLL